ncbi:nucleotidyl transferase AbiEii/AbiGii toxin family protein [Dactylosporangium siamense]|nr:nucleotidyl transferase AbiEii/AbiGii toxin family protein [Dactylosporangium siamense]
MSGDFEIHITVSGWGAERLGAFAAEHGVKYVQIELDRGTNAVQPMLTLHADGTLTEVRQIAASWEARLRQERLMPSRVKIEAAPWNEGVPQTDAEAFGDPLERYFEHHVKLRLPGDTGRQLSALTKLAGTHDARLSRNARRRHEDGTHERFVTQRCRRVGLATARQRLDALVDDLRAAGHEVLDVEQEYVAADNNLALDQGWLDLPRDPWTDWRRSAPAGREGYPATYRPLEPGPGMRQSAAFDPAMKHHPHGYRAGEPEFLDADAGAAWRAARWAAIEHLIGLVAQGPWAGDLVMRGSVPLRIQLGAGAREPGDLDYVVPHGHDVGDPRAGAPLQSLIDAVRDRPGAGLTAEGVTVEEIWTYDRVPGRRLAFPFRVPGVPAGTIQVDLVFGEHLPVPPVPLRVGPFEVPAAPPELALAWKLLWLETDAYPQGKDLYDAVLLAEHGPVDLDLIRAVLREDLGPSADGYGAASIAPLAVDWANFLDEYPQVRGDCEEWKERLSRALDR